MKLMPTHQTKFVPSYVKTTFHGAKLLRVSLPVIAIILLIYAGFLFLKVRHPEVVQSNNFIFNLLDSVFFPSSEDETTKSAQPNNPPDEATPSGQNTNSFFPEDGSLDFMSSDKPTPALFEELDTYIAEMKTAGIDTGLIEKLQLNSQAEREKGNDDLARKKTLWALQLARELLELRKEANSTP